MKHEDLKCEFCNGDGWFSRDNADGVAIEGDCYFCNGSGIEEVELAKTDLFKRSIDLLRDLADIQNGAPLVTLEKEWNEVMDKVYIFLNKYEQPK